MTDEPTRAAQRARRDIAQEITADIVRLLERGVRPWTPPWDEKTALAATPGLPLRATGEPYRGMNVVLLWAAQLARSYPKRTWTTFRQAAALGGHVRKGEKAAAVIYYGQAKTRGAEDGDAEVGERRYRFLKLFHVFNVAQIEDLPAGFGAETAPEPTPTDALEAWARRCEARVIVGGPRAFYSATTDTIHLPPHAAFANDAHRIATLLHELTHHTGHPKRLDRLSGYGRDMRARAREELVAEIGAAMLGAMVGQPPAHIEDHAAYIGEWIGLLNEEPRALLAAAAKAQAAVDWLVAKGGDPVFLAGNASTPATANGV